MNRKFQFLPILMVLTFSLACGLPVNSKTGDVVKLCRIGSPQSSRCQFHPGV